MMAFVLPQTIVAVVAAIILREAGLAEIGGIDLQVVLVGLYILSIATLPLAWSAKLCADQVHPHRREVYVSKYLKRSSHG
jgi:hypothetical protein